MNKEEWQKILYEAEGEYRKKGVLSEEMRQKLNDAKRTAQQEGILTEEELALSVKILKTGATIAKKEGGTPAVEMRFGGRGPRNFGTGEKAKDSRGAIKRLTGYFKAELKIVIALLAAIIIVVLCQVFTPRLQSNAIDFIDEGRYNSLPAVLIWMGALYIILSLFNLLQGILSAVLSQRIVKRMRRDLFHKIINLPIAYFDTHSHGDIMSRMTNDVDNISNTLAQTLGSLFSGILMILGTVIMMFITCWQLALLSCVIVVLTVVATKYLSKAMRKFYSKRQILLGRLNGTVEEMVVGHKTVQAFSKEEEVIREFGQTSAELTKTGIIAEILGGSMGPIMNAINNIGFVIIAAFGGYFAFENIISIGIISAFIIYAKQFSRPINEIAQLYGQLQTALASSERVFHVLDEKAEDKSGETQMEDLTGNVSFENVDFSYVPQKQVLFQFNLEVQQGQRVALVGATGSGKTTVVNLLMRFYDIQSGAIRIGGVNISDISAEDLRKHIGIVLQDTVLFHDTVRNNLKYANPNITDEEMIEAAVKCSCDSFIRQMKGGYDAVLSEGGSNLSQGQRQLLSICRAFLAKPKILILDEATSSVDTRTEKRIQDAMHLLMSDKTSLIIAHRLSTIQDADVIVVMDMGRIVEIGSHENLLSQRGKYYDLYTRQFAGESV